MATQGPTAVPYDASTFANVKLWAGSVQGINKALSSFGWTQVADSNQIDWVNATVAPFNSGVFPNTVVSTSATAGGPIPPYTVNLRGNWVSGTTYNYLDVARSTVGGGGTGNDYILTRSPAPITAIAISANVATVTAANNFVAGDVVRFQCVAAAFLNQGTYTVLAAGLSSSQFEVSTPNVLIANSGSAIGEVTGSIATTPSYAFIVLTSATRPENDTKNWVPYYYEIWKTSDSDSYSETAQSVSYSSVTNVLTIGTNTTTTRIKAGFNISISGATNFPQINGTWCVNSATTTQLTFVIPTSVSGFSASFSGTDSFTVSYSLQPIYMKLEYWASSAATGASPWVRVSFGTWGDGNGNLTGNRFASDNLAAEGRSGYGGFSSPINLTSSSQCFADLVGSNLTPNTSAIFRSIWSGSNNQFGTALFYNRNDTNAAQPTGASFGWIVERARDNSGNAVDDYFTCLFMSASTTITTLNSTNPVAQRSVLKPNPTVKITQAGVDGTNNLTVNYNNGNAGYQFQIGAVVYIQSAANATFLNGQFVRVNQVNLTLASAANASAGSTVYTGTITGGNGSFYAGQTFVITGFTNAANNGTFACTASTSTTLTLSNAGGVAETHAAAAIPALPNGLFTGTFAHASYGPAFDSGIAIQSTSPSALIPIANTGFVCWNDIRIASVRTSNNSASITVNGNTPLFPVFPIPGYVGNPMTMAASSVNAVAPAHDTTLTVTLYGATRTYYQPQGFTGMTAPWTNFGQDSSTGAFFLRWD